MAGAGGGEVGGRGGEEAEAVSFPVLFDVLHPQGLLFFPFGINHHYS